MKKKILALCLVVALAATAIVGGTLAYFTDTTDKMVNTFTVGKVDIDLSEPNWDAEEDHTLMPGTSYQKDPTITVDEKSQDAYVFLEMTFNKYNSLLWVMAADASADTAIDFTIYNDDGGIKDAFKNDAGKFSTSKFVAALAENNNLLNQIVGKWFTGINASDWAVKFYDMGNVNTNLMTIRLAYIGGDDILSANDSVTFMTAFGMPASVTQEMIDAGVTVGGQKSTFNTDLKDFQMNFTAYAIQAAEIAGIDAAYDALFN